MPEPKCQIRGHDNQIKCELLDTDDRTKSFTVLLEYLDKGMLEPDARMLKSGCANRASTFHLVIFALSDVRGVLGFDYDSNARAWRERSHLGGIDA